MIIELMRSRFFVGKVNALPEIDCFDGVVSVVFDWGSFSIIFEESHHFRWKMDFVFGPWSLFKIRGVIDFSETGVLGGICSALADGGVSVLVVSSYDTDMILVQSDQTLQASSLLKNKGHEIIEVASD